MLKLRSFVVLLVLVGACSSAPNSVTIDSTGTDGASTSRGLSSSSHSGTRSDDGVSSDAASTDRTDSGDSTGGSSTGEVDERPTGVWINGENLPTPPTRPFSPVPDPGVHPRVLMSPEDLPAHRAAALEEGTVAYAAMDALRVHVGTTLDDASHELGAAYQQALSGSLVAPSDALLGSGNVGVYGSGTSGLYGTLASAGWLALMDEDASRGDELGRALRAVAAAHNAIYTPAIDNALCHDANADLGLAYDFLHTYMSEGDRAQVRTLLSRMTTGRQAYGVGMSASAVSTNWRTHHDHIVIAALAIEGEDGYDAHVFESNVGKLQSFASAYGINSSGMPHEGLAYFAFGMHWGALSTLATARRGDNLFETTHYYRALHYALRETAPWAEGQVFGHADGAGWSTGTGASSFYTITKNVWPDDPMVDFIYRENRTGGRQERLPLIEAMFGLEPLSIAPTPASIATELELPLALYSPAKGYAYARSSWDPDAVRLDFDARSDLWDLGHIHADRNGFTMSALGRRWVFDPGYHMEYSDLHSSVLIDGRGQSGTSTDDVQLWPPMPAKMLEVRNSDSLFVAAGDATLAYSLARPRGEDLPDSGYTWGDLLADPDYTDEQHALPLLAREYNPVRFAYRTVALARGEHPFVVVADDIQKDEAPHTYQWVFNTRGAYPWNQLTVVMEPGATSSQAVLRHEADVDPGTPRLLVEVLAGEGEAEIIALRDDQLTASSGDPHTHRRLFIERSQTVSPGFRIALIPFREGEPLPVVEYDGTTLSVTHGGQTQTLSFSMDGDRTLIDL